MPVNSFFNNSKVDGEEYEAADVEAIEQGFYDVEQAMVKSTNNLSDVASASAARTNLGLGGAAILSVGTTAGTVAAGDHNHTGVYEAANANIQAHVSSTSNPHNTTKTHVGLGNVDNTSDADKPVSTAQQTALDGKEASIGAKGTAFNKSFGTTAGTVSEGNHTHSGTYEPAQTAASQAEMEAGTETAIRSMSPLRVKQAIDALASSGVADNSITLAKLAHGTAGNLIAFDAAGAPAAVATGTAAQVLTSNGAGAAPTMQSLPSTTPPANSVGNDELKKSFQADGSWPIPDGGATRYIVPAGVYMVVSAVNTVLLSLYASGAWRDSFGYGQGGLIISDGANVAFKTTGWVGAAYVYYKKLA